MGVRKGRGRTRSSSSRDSSSSSQSPLAYLGCMRVVGAADRDRLLIHQALDPLLRQPMELDIDLLALTAEQLVGVHAKAVHVAVVARDAQVVDQEREPV